jgi:hypothetical protein
VRWAMDIAAKSRSIPGVFSLGAVIHGLFNLMIKVLMDEGYENIVSDPTIRGQTR